MSTISKDFKSYVELILFAENILGVVPRNTHDWNKFINSKDLE